MTSTPVSIDRFGTLNLRDESAAVGFEQAVDLLNVDLTIPGRLSTRVGYTKMNLTTPASPYFCAVESRAGGTAHIAAFRNAGPTVVDSIAADGTVTSAAATFAANFQPYSTAEYGTPSGTLLYIADTGIATSNTLQKWNGATLANSSGKPAWVAVTPWDNRLAQGYYGAAGDTPSGANGSSSTVFFSDVGAPDTYTSTSFVQLHPGDGEGITGMVAWRDLLFVFKETAVYIFYGTSTAANGTPIFNYRRVTLPSPVILYGSPFAPPGSTFTVSNSISAGPGGVFYHAADGIYMTTGDTPVEVSNVIRGIFTGSAASSLRRNNSSSSAYNTYLTAVGERVFLSYVNGDANPRFLVFDRPSGTWTVWSAPTLATSVPMFGAGLVSPGRAQLPFFVDDTTADIFYFGSGTDDNGTAISWSYKSGFDPMGFPGQSKILRESALWGTGTVTAKMASDFGALDTGGSVTLGTSPAIARGWQQIDREGSYLQYQLSGSGQAVVNRYVQYVAEAKDPVLE